MKTLAIDQGTTSTRAVLVDERGGTRVLLSRPNPATHPGTDRVEQDPERLIADLGACLESIDGTADVGVVGLANQGESCLAWDADSGRAISPVISWQDARTRGTIARLEADGAGALVRERAGLPLDAYFSAAKLGWIVAEIPEARRLAARGRLRLGTSDAFFRDRLTGRHESDVTTASRTSLMNLASGEWDETLCALFGVPIEALPAIGASAGELGVVRLGTSERPLGSSLVDQQASLYGHGCRAAGDAKMTFGTGAFASVVCGTDLPRELDGPLPTVAWRRAGEATVHALDGGVYAAGSAVDWARDAGLCDALADTMAFDGPPAIAEGLAFVPALTGLACPHWDRRARGGWLGLSPRTTRESLMRAVLEGVAFRTGEVVAALDAHVPIRGTISIDGGMSVNPHFRTFLASVLGRELRVSDEPELTALGAAALAAEAVARPFPLVPRGIGVEPEGLPANAVADFASARRALQEHAERVGTR